MARNSLPLTSLLAWTLWPIVAFLAVLAFTVNWRGSSLTIPIAIEGGILLALLVTNTLVILRLRRLGVLRNTLALCLGWLCLLLAQMAIIFIGANLIFATMYEKPGGADMHRGTQGAG